MKVQDCLGIPVHSVSTAGCLFHMQGLLVVRIAETNLRVDRLYNLFFGITVGCSTVVHLPYGDDNTVQNQLKY